MKVDMSNVIQVLKFDTVRIDFIKEKTTPRESIKVWSKKVTKQRKEIESPITVTTIICKDEKQRNQLYASYVKQIN